MTESLYGDRKSFVVGGLAVFSAACVTAWRTGVPLVWVIAAAIGTMTLIRLVAFELFLANETHADRHPAFWRRLYSILGVAHLLIIGSWSTAIYWLAGDHFSELLSITATLAYLIGTQGRNFASIALVRAQLLAGLIPMILAFYARSPGWSISFSIFVVAFYFSVMQTTRRIRTMFRQAIETAEENWRLAHTDPLTGTANRISMQEAMGRAVEERQSFTLHYIDLDRFKRVNDTLGHIAGDQLLRQTANRLQKIIGSGGLVSRVAGDEFIVFQLADLDMRTPADCAAEIIDALNRPVVINGATMPNSASLGYARYPQDAATIDAVSHCADMALYEAKSKGGGHAIAYQLGTPDRAADRLQLENDLRRALRENALELYFQPIVHNGSFKISGCEALVRWHHPTRGAIPPAEFLPVAEDAGLMGKLTDQTFRAGCRAAMRWPDHVGVSINLSPSQLTRVDLLSMICQALSEAGLPPERLEVEITENLFIEDREDLREALEGIRGLGVRLSLDDFGTGYSNLVQIALLPINKIKLDKSFLKNISTDERKAAVLRGAVRFIAPLGLDVVLEGVETPEQVDFAASLEGLTHLQGYAFGAPMPDHIVEGFLASYKARPVLPAVAEAPVDNTSLRINF
ncbi:putative bifunctional diguanylate cyclase/phosphodiesterase [Aureimonas mangrovi]|uniref:putative bifunctional diguanylate cyclase/phosphodiesterase n=1 Tax=Aureimonas mangrovi TaxID=2758041 RepID=UPI00163D920A|nr:EAL domain-containing protein [Aureimonas mangrovi]